MVNVNQLYNKQILQCNSSQNKNGSDSIDWITSQIHKFCITGSIISSYSNNHDVADLFLSASIANTTSPAVFSISAIT